MIDFPLYIPEKRESERMIFFRYIKNNTNNKNYILSLSERPTEQTLKVLGLNSFRVFNTCEELKELFKKIAEAESSIEGVSLFKNDSEIFFSLK